MKIIPMMKMWRTSPDDMMLEQKQCFMTGGQVETELVTKRIAPAKISNLSMNDDDDPQISESHYNDQHKKPPQ